MKQIQQGFTLIELMIVVAIIGILASMAIGSYQSYTVRAQVSEGLNLSGTLKNGVAAFINENGAFPTDNADAALEAAADYAGTYVQRYPLPVPSYQFFMATMPVRKSPARLSC